MRSVRFAMASAAVALLLVAVPIAAHAVGHNSPPEIVEVTLNGVVVVDTSGTVGSLTANEGETIALEVDFDDPDLADTHTVVINWGDGTTSTVNVPALTSPPTVRMVTVTHVYSVSADTTFTIDVDVTDSASGEDDASALITVLNVNNSPGRPVDVDPADDEVFEGAAVGSTVGLTAQAIDPDGDTVTYSLTDDAGGRFQINAASGVVTVLDGSLLDGPDVHTITVKAADPSGEMSTADFTIEVRNVQPFLGLTGFPVPGDEGATFTLGVVSVTDPGNDTITTYRFIWGDGTPDTVISATDLANQGNTVTHVYDDGDSAPDILVRVTDEDGTFAAGFLLVSPGFGQPGVRNVAPTADFGNDGPVDEGTTATVSFTNQFDPSTADTTAGLRYSYDLDNNGSFDDGAGDGTYAGSLTTASQTVPASFLTDGPGTHTVGGRIVDKDDGRTDLSTEIAFGNVAPTLTLDPVTMIDESGVATLTGTITDPGTLDTFTLDIDWGDPLSPDNTETFNFAASPTGSQTFTLTHQYLDDNPSGTVEDTYTINGTVTDDDNLSGSAATSVLVRNVAPTLTVNPLSAPGTKDDKATVTDDVTVSGSFTDVGMLDAHTVIIDWGEIADTAPNADDDRTVLGFAATDPKAFAETHRYAKGGIFIVTVTVIDDDTGQAVATTSEVWVSGVRLDPNTGELQIVGTAGQDDIEVKLRRNEVIQVKAKLNKGGASETVDVTFDRASVTGILIVLCDGDDKAKVHKKVDVPATIEGDGGDDQLDGGDGADLIDGGPGDDKVNGHSGNDTLFGGGGDDDLKGDRGDDTLSAGSGEDKLDGNRGRDILIGGLGADKAKGGGDGDLLVGGFTIFDDDAAGLDAIRLLWTSPLGYTDRVDALTDPGGPLEPEVAVFGDDARDKLEGRNNALDLFFAETGLDEVKGDSGDVTVPLL